MAQTHSKFDHDSTNSLRQNTLKWEQQTGYHSQTWFHVNYAKYPESNRRQPKKEKKKKSLCYRNLKVQDVQSENGKVSGHCGKTGSRATSSKKKKLKKTFRKSRNITTDNKTLLPKTTTGKLQPFSAIENVKIIIIIHFRLFLLIK